MTTEDLDHPSAVRSALLVTGLVVVWALLVRWALDGGQHGLHTDPVAWFDLLLLPLAVVAILGYGSRRAQHLLSRVVGALAQIVTALVAVFGALVLTLSRFGSGSTEDGLEVSEFWSVAAVVAVLTLVVLAAVAGWAAAGASRSGAPGRRVTPI